MERFLYLDSKIFGLKDFSKNEIMVKAYFPGAQMVSLRWFFTERLLIILSPGVVCNPNCNSLIVQSFLFPVSWNDKAETNYIDSDEISHCSSLEYQDCGSLGCGTM